MSRPDMVYPRIREEHMADLTPNMRPDGQSPEDERAGRTI